MIVAYVRDTHDGQEYWAKGYIRYDGRFQALIGSRCVYGQRFYRLA